MFTTRSIGVIGLGSANLGNLYRAMTDDMADAIVARARHLGIVCFDTAPHYGLGLSERRLGRALAHYPRGDLVLSTKVGRLLVPSPDGLEIPDDDAFAVSSSLRRQFDFSASGIRRSLEASLIRLDTDYVDIAYLHDPEEFNMSASLESGLRALESLREEGLIGAVGVGSKSVAAHAMALEITRPDVLMVAGRYTLLDNVAAEVLLDACSARGIAVVSAAVFNSGLLASPRPRSNSHYENGEIPPKKFKRARALAEVCSRHGVELPATALQFPLRHPAVVSIIAGASSPEQVSMSVDRVRQPIPAAFWAELASLGLLRSA